jgi:hypothetical protein
VVADSGSIRSGVRSVVGQPELGLTRERRQELANLVVGIIRSFEKGNEWGCYVLASEVTDTYEQLWLWLQLETYPGIRAAIKRFQIAERKYDAEHQGHDPVEIPKGK